MAENGIAGGRLAVRVYFEDTDATGFAYHAAYVRFLERGRTELLRSAQLAQSELREADGFNFLVRRITLDFLAPARLDDLLTIHTTPVKVGGASIHLGQTVMRGDTILVQAEVHVAGTRNGKAARLPDAVRAALTP
jgi:acyl-CoA thioester hydrolase